MKERTRKLRRKFREVYETQRRLRGPEHSYTLNAMTNLAGALQNLKRNAEAEELGRAALEIERRKLGDENSLTLVQMDTLANSLEQLGRYAEAERLLQELVDHQAHVFGSDSPESAQSRYKLATWAAPRGEGDKALSLLSKAVSHGLDAATAAGIEKATAFKSLHGDPRFEAIIAEARQHSVAKQKAN